MEFKVRAIDGIEQKSISETEEELLKKHQAANEGGQDDGGSDDGEGGSDDAGGQDSELSEEQVLSYIAKRYNKQINSFDELISERSSNEDIPEDIAAYMKYKKETGRSFEDFQKLNRNYDEMDADVLLREYLAATQNGLDKEDIDVLMEDYTFDEELDEESRVKKVRIARKKAISEAKNYFNNLKETYKAPLESSGSGLSKEEQEQFNAYREYIKKASSLEEENNRKRQWFDQKTNEVFSKDFNGFDFEVGGRKVLFTPSSADELKKVQSTPANFVSKFLDENGMIKDAVGYHKALAIAMNPEKFAKFFYEQGQADATDDVLKKTKNINMSERRSPEVVTKGGFQVKAVNPSSGNGLKIKSVNKN